jgi:hypothetical protein
VPSIYLGIFNDVKWIRYDAGENKQVQFIMSSYNNDGRKLISSASASKVSKGKEYSYAKFNPSAFFDTEFGSNQDTVLDIDLDYFSCADDTYFNNEIIIETTKTEYEDFVSDKYHKFNFILGKVEAIEKEGKYYFIINYFKYTYPESRKVGEDTILARIDEFIGLLKRKNIKPKVITICRSRFSGFTPSDQWEYIESNLLDRLNDFYALELTKINEILSE